jgi:hypothetical protein
LHRADRLIGLPISATTWLFPTCPCGLYPVPSPVFLRIRVHPLIRHASCSEFMTVPNLAVFSRFWPPSLGVFLPIATSAQRIYHPTNLPQFVSRSALSVSHTLDGLPLAAPCGLISSHYHVRDSLFRGFPRYPADSPFDASCPLGFETLHLQPSCPNCPAPSSCSSRLYSG